MATVKIEEASALLSRETTELPVMEPSTTVSPPPSTHATKGTDEIARWARAGELATAAAHAFLRAHGASIIYGCGDAVCEELPDGTVVVHPPGKTPSKLRDNTQQKVVTS